MARQLKALIPNVFLSNTWKYKLLKEWENIMGDLHTKVHIEKIYNDTLILGVTSSCWLQELYMLSPILLKKINQNLDNKSIKTLRFKKVGKKEKVAPKRKLVPKKCPKEGVLSDKQIKTLEHIQDPHLRKVLEKFGKRCSEER